jgi:hypothetical protein
LEISNIWLPTQTILNTSAPAPVANNWWMSLLMSISPACCARLECVRLSFVVWRRSEMEKFAWGQMEQVLSPARCPRLRTLRLEFATDDSTVTEHEITECLSGLASGGVVSVEVLESRVVWRRVKPYADVVNLNV